MQIKNNKLGNYRLPILIFTSQIVGLLLALQGDGVWDYLCWILVFLPFSIGCYLLIKRWI